MTEIDCINVGYGDSILLRSDGYCALIDCGDISSRVVPGKGERVTAADFLRAQGIDTLDLLWITHLHLDHVGGLESLENRIQIKKMIVPYLPAEKLTDNTSPLPEGAPDGVACLIKAINIYAQAVCSYRKSGTEIVVCNPMTEKLDEIYVGEFRLTPFFVNNPECFLFMRKCFDDALMGQPCTDDLLVLDEIINSCSVGVHVETDRSLIELPGDLDLASCKALLNKPCDIFKMPHHGHNHSIDADLVQCIRPKHTVISVSDDRADPCPHESSIRMASAYGDVSFTDAVAVNGARLYHQSVHFCLD